MDPKQLSLLAAKLIVIQKLVAKQHGMGDVGELSSGEYQRKRESPPRILKFGRNSTKSHSSTQSDEPFNALARECFAMKKKIEG